MGKEGGVLGRDAGEIPVSRVPRIASGGAAPEADGVAAQKRAGGEEAKLLRVLRSVPAELWEGLIRWSRESGHLSVREREVALVMKSNAERGRLPTPYLAERPPETRLQMHRHWDSSIGTRCGR